MWEYRYDDDDGDDDDDDVVTPASNLQVDRTCKASGLVESVISMQYGIYAFF